MDTTPRPCTCVQGSKKSTPQLIDLGAKTLLTSCKPVDTPTGMSTTTSKNCNCGELRSLLHVWTPEENQELHLWDLHGQKPWAVEIQEQGVNGPHDLESTFK